MKKIKSQKDSSIKIVSKETALWADFKKRIEASLEGLEKELTINKEILKMCEGKLLDCKEEYNL